MWVFVVDVFSMSVMGWSVSRSMKTELVRDALEKAIWVRNIHERLIHHSGGGSQYISIRYTERLAEAGISESVGATGDSYDDAIAVTIIGLYKTEDIYHLEPWKGLDAVEFATLERVD